MGAREDIRAAVDLIHSVPLGFEGRVKPNGRRLLRDEAEARWGRLRGAWKRRDGTIAKACEKPPQPLGPHEFSPVVLHPLDEKDRLDLRCVRNARKRARKAGKAPPTWREYGH